MQRKIAVVCILFQNRGAFLNENHNKITWKIFHTVNMKYFGHEKHHQWNIVPWFSEEPSMWNEAESTVKAVLPSGAWMTDWNRPFGNIFCSLKAQSEIAVVSNAMTTFPLTLVVQILAQENLSDYQLTWLTCKTNKKCCHDIAVIYLIKCTRVAGKDLKSVMLLITQKANFPFHNNPVEMLPIQLFLLMEIIVMKERSIVAI